MEKKNLAIAWNWEYDKDFVTAIVAESERRGVTTMLMNESNLPEVLDNVANGSLSIDVLFDRASDSDDAFVPLVNALKKQPARILNDYYLAERARDKATMHLELMSSGLIVPHSLIIPPYYSQPFLFLAEKEIMNLGMPFVVKPANTTGGGFGVHVNAHSMMDVHLARQEFPGDKYLVQELMTPKIIEGNRAWFRVLYAFGEVFPCWWDDETHIYKEVTLEQELMFELSPLRNYMHTIQRLCGLDFFSSEIVMTPGNSFVVVDYVNEVCDMRLQSTCVDGVPDELVSRIVTLLVNEVTITLNRSPLTD